MTTARWHSALLILVLAGLACQSQQAAPSQSGQQQPPAAAPTQRPAPSTWNLEWSPSYVLEYDASAWSVQATKPAEGVITFATDLALKNDPVCRISQPGPMGMPPDTSPELIGAVHYTVTSRLDGVDPFMAYVATNEVDPQTDAHPFFIVFVPASNPDACLNSARSVLAALRQKP